jgi:hypothetical protein
VLSVSQIAHVLPPGAYSYPFSFALAPTLPGCAHYHRETDADDPAWRERGRRNKVHGEVTFRLKAYVDVSGVFSRDLVCRQALTVNPAVDWSAMQPARGVKTANVVCGGVADDAPVGGWPSLGAAIAWLFPGGMPLPPPPPPLSACPRCGLGRACTAHTDCDRNEGHLCARLLGAPVCAPWWVVNATAFVQVRPSATVEGAQTPCCAHS